MFNDRMSNEEAKERIAQRVKEVESYSSQDGLDHGRRGAARWVFVFIVLAAVVVSVGLLL